MTSAVIEQNIRRPAGRNRPPGGHAIRTRATAAVKDLLIVIGEHGETFARETLGLSAGRTAKQCPRRYAVAKPSALADSVIAQAEEHGIERLLIVGHLDKLVSDAASLSRKRFPQGDRQVETLTACAIEAGAGFGIASRLLACASTDAAVAILIEADLISATMSFLRRRVQESFDRRAPEGLRLEWLCFTAVEGIFTPIMFSPAACSLIREWRHEHE